MGRRPGEFEGQVGVTHPENIFKDDEKSISDKTEKELHELLDSFTKSFA